jgi:hypothetical protein
MIAAAHAAAALLLAVTACASEPVPGPMNRSGSGDAPATVSHELLDKVLGRHVKDGLVDYPSIKQDPYFSAYLAELSRIDPTVLVSREEKLAFWINAYNSLVLKGVVDHYPIKSVADVGILGKWGFFNILKFDVGGRTRALDQIEHGIIRPDFHDPRTHFALVCASGGCPKLRSEAFHPNHLDAELDLAAGDFINDPGKVRLDRERGVLYVSSIFKWYEDDFVKAYGSVPAFIGKYIRQDLPAGAHLEYLDYSWALNDLTNPPTAHS